MDVVSGSLLPAPWLVSPPNARATATFLYAYASVFGEDTNHGTEEVHTKNCCRRGLIISENNRK